MRDKTGRTLFRLMEHVPYVFSIFDPRNVEVVYINRAYESMWGRSRHSIYRQPLSYLDVVHPEDQAKVSAKLVKVLRGQANVLDYRIVPHGGEVRWVRARSFPVKIEPEGIVYMAGTAEYITRSHRTKPRVKRTPNKAVEQLAGGVAHDFNNLLTAVMGNGDFLLKDASLSIEAQSRANVIVQAAELGKTLAKELTDFSRLAVTPFMSVDLNALIRCLAGSFRSLLGSQIELTTFLVADLVSIRANPEQLTRVLTNLVFNARDAMPSGGGITISTYNAEEAGMANGTRTLCRDSESYAAVEVSDTGCGMNSATQARIFEPFFTTKLYRVGTGLGLYHVKRIVHECHGRICVSSAVGKGTTFTLYFPRAITVG